jgi:alpha-D-ribose 1-methylphosphonate 5-triphosphate synthase subunit PhnG
MRKSEENESAQHSEIGLGMVKGNKVGCGGESIIIDSKVLLKRSKVRLCGGDGSQYRGQSITMVSL